tara:strand:+ start:102 stop:380 length:279 start_codon:yes stop_codon:yes gene_type:complete
MPETNPTPALVELNGRFDRLMDNIDQVKDNQDRMADDISKIKEAVYNPDEGLYARLRALESWKRASAKLMWMIVTGIVSLGTAFFWSNFLDK